MSILDGTAFVAEIKRWTPRPGDVFVIETPEGMNTAEVHRLVDGIRHYWPQRGFAADFVVLPPGCKVAVLDATLAKEKAVE